MGTPEKKEWVFKRAPQFRKSFSQLSAEAQAVARVAYKEWKKDPLNPHSKFRPHKINRLTALYKKTVYGIELGNDFRATFLTEGNVVKSLDIGDHGIYH